MLEETGFIAREEGDEFLVLTCPECSTSIVFTQRVDLLAIRVATDTHTNRCLGKMHSSRSRVAEVVAAGR
jgi:hypothetical protein